MNQNEHNIDFTEISNKDPRTIKIIVGMTGKTDSLVSAYLLLKQGFQCIGVGIMTYNNPAYNFNLEKSCSVTEFDKIKLQCDKLGMPFYAVDAQKEYQELILNQMMADKLAGNSTYTCVNCHSMKLRILAEKMKKLGAHLIATGHYAKCYKNHANHTFSVHSASDKDSDQSHLLVGAPQEVLAKLVLPLAELHKEEVERLAHKFHFKDVVSSKGTKCFADENEVYRYIQENIPNDFRENGPVMDTYTLIPIQEHEGVYRHTVGVAKEVSDRAQVEVKVPIKISLMEKTVYMGYPSDFQYDFMQLVQVSFHKEIDRGAPIHVFARIGEEHKTYSGTVFFKTHNSIILFLNEKVLIKPLKQVVFFYNKEGAAAKLLGKGEIAFMGKHRPLERANMDHQERIEPKSAGEVKEEVQYTPTQLGFKF